MSLLVRAVTGVVPIMAIGAVAASAAVFPVSETPATFTGPTATYAVLDFDGDGYRDVMWIDDRLRLVLGGPGGFASAQSVELPERGYMVDVAAADLTGDSRDELLATYGTSGTLIVVRGRADGRLQAPGSADRYQLRPAISGYGRPTALDVGDVDGDRDIDVVAGIGVQEDDWHPPNKTDNGEVAVMLNDGQGVLSRSGQTLAVNAPIDVELVPVAGSDPDLFVLQRNKSSSENLRRFRAAPGPAFEAAEALAGGELAWGDFNADGFGDLVMAAEHITVLPGPDLTAAVAVPDTRGGQLAVADLDADGHQDIYMARGEPPFYGGATSPVFLHGTGALGFVAVRSTPSTQIAGENRPYVVDLDRDGKLDVVSAGFGGTGAGLLARFGLGPQLAPDPYDVRFDDQAVGTFSASQQVKITNEGGGVATGIQPQVERDAPDFDIDLGTCATATLRVAQSCSIAVRFAPTGGGLREADVALFGADSEIGWVLTLAGRGFTPPRATITPSPTPLPTVAPTAVPTATPRPQLRLPIAKVARATLASLRRRGLRVTQRFPAAGHAHWTLETTSGLLLARTERRINGAGSVTITLRLSARGRARLSSGRLRRFVLRTRFVDAADRSVKRTTRIVRTG